MQTGKLKNQENQAYTTIGGQLPDATGDFENVVTTTETTYTEEQKAQSRDNLAVVSYEAQALTDEQKAQARTNIGAGTGSGTSYDDTEVRSLITANTTAIGEKQDTLTAGENITIEGDVISATGGSSVDISYATSTTIGGFKYTIENGVARIFLSDIPPVKFLKSPYVTVSGESWALLSDFNPTGVHTITSRFKLSGYGESNWASVIGVRTTSTNPDDIEMSFTSMIDGSAWISIGTSMSQTTPNNGSPIWASTRQDIDVWYTCTIDYTTKKITLITDDGEVVYDGTISATHVYNYVYNPANPIMLFDRNIDDVTQRRFYGDFDYVEFKDATGKTMARFNAGIEVATNEAVVYNEITNTKVEMLGRPITAPKKQYKVLSIGNSFSQDTQSWAGVLTDTMGVDVLWDNAYHGACSLEEHITFINNDSAEYIHQKIRGSQFTSIESQTLDTIINSQEWDLITIQQVSSNSGVYSTVTPYLQDILDWVKEKSPSTPIAWHSTWAYSTDSTHAGFPTYDSNQITMYNAIVDVGTKVKQDYSDIAFIIPNNTIIQNARTNSILSALDDELTRDGYHLADNSGRILGSYGFTSFIMNHLDSTLDYTDISYQNIQGINKDVWTESVDALGRKALQAAIDNPNEITTIQ